jgi:hypothetical protein
VLDTVLETITQGTTSVLIGNNFASQNTIFELVSFDRYKVPTVWETSDSVAFAVPEGYGGPYPVALAVGNMSSIAPLDFYYFRMLIGQCEQN